MTTIERKDLVDAVLRTRDAIDPSLESELLEAIVNAEASAGGDGDAAIRTIDAAVNAAIERGVGRPEDGGLPPGGVAVSEEDEEDET